MYKENTPDKTKHNYYSIAMTMNALTRISKAKENKENTYAKAIAEAWEKDLIRYSKPERIVFNGPATIAFWKDGTKTIVRCQDGEPFDPEKGVAMAILKKCFGGGRYNDVIRELINNATFKNKE